jgi:hypothetical protein
LLGFLPEIIQNQLAAVPFQFLSRQHFYPLPDGHLKLF